MISPQEMEARAERAVRRGELPEALGLYRDLARDFPGEVRFQSRLAQLELSLQPAELARTPPRVFASSDELRPATPEQEGERLFALGDFAGAAAAYRRAVAQRPDSELIRERLVEIYRLARSTPVHSPTDRALPEDRSELLLALLDRIASRRRVGRKDAAG